MDSKKKVFWLCMDSEYGRRFFHNDESRKHIYLKLFWRSWFQYPTTEFLLVKFHCFCPLECICIHKNCSMLVVTLLNKLMQKFEMKIIWEFLAKLSCIMVQMRFFKKGTDKKWIMKVKNVNIDCLHWENTLSNTILKKILLVHKWSVLEILESMSRRKK